jgi:hypothetical protein
LPSFNFDLKYEGPTDEDGRKRIVFMSDGNSAILEAKDPFGFWYIRYDKGRTPDELVSQSFTNFNSAQAALEKFLSSNRYNTKVTEEKVEIPVLKTKKDKAA